MRCGCAVRLRARGGVSIEVGRRQRRGPRDCLRRVDLGGCCRRPRCASCIGRGGASGRGRPRPGGGRWCRRSGSTLGGRAGRLLLVIHHLAVDGVSWRILLPDLAAAWAAVARGADAAAGAGRHAVPALGAAAGGAGAGPGAASASCPSGTAMLARAALPLIDGALDPGRDTVARAGSCTLTLPAAVTERC